MKLYPEWKTKQIPFDFEEANKDYDHNPLLPSDDVEPWIDLPSPGKDKRKKH